jgi:AmiR/NasT family two-component response regulator
VRAKELLRKKAQVEEEEACRRLQKMARDQNRKLIDVAQRFRALEGALRAIELT